MKCAFAHNPSLAHFRNGHFQCIPNSNIEHNKALYRTWHYWIERRLICGKLRGIVWSRAKSFLLKSCYIGSLRLYEFVEWCLIRTIPQIYQSSTEEFLSYWNCSFRFLDSLYIPAAFWINEIILLFFIASPQPNMALFSRIQFTKKRLGLQRIKPLLYYPCFYPVHSGCCIHTERS